MDLPRLSPPITLVFRSAKEMPRFLLTWAAAMHWPRFLKPAHAVFASMPVKVEIFEESFVFRERISLAACPLLEAEVFAA